MATDPHIPDLSTPSSATTARTDKPKRNALRVFLRKIRIPAAIALVLLAILLTAVSLWLRSITQPYIYTDLARMPTRPVGIVFGAMVYDKDKTGSILQQRIRAGAALYKAGKVQKLLLTGKVTGPDYDEVGPMVRMSEKLGVPASAIITDSQSFRTYDSCYRARSVFHIRSAILVTQNFHLPRALYLARNMGIDAVGYTAAPPPGLGVRLLEDVRELFADLLAPLDIKFRGRGGL